MAATAPESMEPDAPPPPPAVEEPNLLSADDFIQSLGDNPVVELQIRIPNDASSQNWNFFGQTLTLEGINPRSVVKEVKEILSKQHLNSMPVNKIQLRSISTEGDSKGTLGILGIPRDSQESKRSLGMPRVPSLPFLGSLGILSLPFGTLDLFADEDRDASGEEASPSIGSPRNPSGSPRNSYGIRRSPSGTLRNS